VHAAQDREGRRAAFVAALRRAKSQFLVDVAMADLDGTLGTREATRLLSEMADQQLERATRFEMGEPVRGLAVIAMGKLGGSDIGYASDLDVLFVYDPDAAPSRDDALAHFARRAQRIIRLISEPHDVGPGYELDTRLRPSGSHGMLVTTAASFARYHGVGTEAAAGETQLAVLASGAAWERQALLRARACAGDLELGARAIRIAEVAAYELGAPAPEELHRLRMRMQRELGRERPRRYDIKTGEGGLLDIEFAVQWLQMRFGQDRSLRTTDTGNALEALHRGSYLEIAHYATLLDGYRFLRRLEQRMVIQGGASSTVLDLRRPGLAQVARRMGLQDTPGASARELLMSRYLDIRGAVRAAYRDILGVPPD
jgi:glutamate-ammonia-ligase adenylyltransferase